MSRYIYFRAVFRGRYRDKFSLYQHSCESKSTSQRLPNFKINRLSAMDENLENMPKGEGMRVLLHSHFDSMKPAFLTILREKCKDRGMTVWCRSPSCRHQKLVAKSAGENIGPIYSHNRRLFSLFPPPVAKLKASFFFIPHSILIQRKFCLYRSIRNVRRNTFVRGISNRGKTWTEKS
jgi:hypothetical protein